jgi:hypothetical protein
VGAAGMCHYVSFGMFELSPFAPVFIAVGASAGLVPDLSTNILKFEFLNSMNLVGYFV